MKLDIIGNYLYKARLKTVKPHIRGRLLDLGCGTNKLAKEYGDGVGVDVFDFGGADLIIPDTSQTPFDDESFDTITIIAALNHIPNRESVLREMNRITKPSGKLIITMIPPIISMVWHLLRSPWDNDQKERGMKEGEVYGLTDRQLEQLITAAGFKLIERKKFMLRINRLIIAQK